MYFPSGDQLESIKSCLLLSIFIDVSFVGLNKNNSCLWFRMINISSLGDFLTDNIRPKSTLDFFIVLDVIVLILCCLYQKLKVFFYHY